MRLWLCAALLVTCAALRADAWQEAPALAEQVKAGKLPPVEQRLPEHPAMVEPAHSLGKYGGTWRRMAVMTMDVLQATRIGYEPLVRWDQSGTKVIPGVAEGWEVRDGGRTFIFHLRKGHKWSDGTPLTSEDVMFWYEDMRGNPELSPAVADELWQTLKVTAPDPLTVEFRFDQPNGLFLESIAFGGNSWIVPKHYLKQFHPRYADLERLKEMARAATGSDLWFVYFNQINNPNENPDLPVLKAWKLISRPPNTQMICERNPYYYKVDPAGNQLPYLDRVVSRMVQSGRMVNLKAMSGEVDFQERYIDSSEFGIFQKYSRLSREKSDVAQRFRVMHDLIPGSSVIYVNQHSRDPVMRALLQDRRFRIALSVAVNRREVVELVYDGLASPSRGVAGPFDPYYLPEFNTKYIEYDPALANRLLDEAGLKRDGDGMRRWPDGREFRPTLNVYPAETGTDAELWQLIIEQWREVGLDFVMRTDARTLSVMRVANGDSDLWAYTSIGVHWILDPATYVPWGSNSYFAPLYGLYQRTGGKRGVKPRPEFQRLVDEYLEMRGLLADDPRRLELGRAILRQWSEECYTIGIVHPQALTIVSDRFKNVPDHIIHEWQVMTPGYMSPEQFYIDEE